MTKLITTSVHYEICDNAEDDRHEDYCESVIAISAYNAKRDYLISTLAWDLGGQRPVCDSCEQAYADSYTG